MEFNACAKRVLPILAIRGRPSANYFKRDIDKMVALQETLSSFRTNIQKKKKELTKKK